MIMQYRIYVDDNDNLKNNSIKVNKIKVNRNTN